MQSIRSRLIYHSFKLAGSPFAANRSLAQQRAMLERQCKLTIMPGKVKVQPTAINEMYAEWLKPDFIASDRTILYLHGGWYTMGSCSTHRALAARIARASHAPALLIDYRLAPENPFPAALEDAKKAYRWLIDQGIEAEKMIFVGDSAGGGLAVATAIALREENEPLPGGIACISPWADLTLSGETISTLAKSDPMSVLETSQNHADSYAGKQDLKSQLISPVFADLSHLPPLLIQVGEYEILQSDSSRLSENACQAGVKVILEVWDRMWHVWHMFAGYMPEANRAIDRIGFFVSELR
jgi:monoterpene epsilon-lactone hydrolase